MDNPNHQPLDQPNRRGYRLSKLFRFFDYSLRTKLISAFLVVTLMPLGLLALMNYVNARRVLINEANQRLEAAALQTATNIDAFIQTNLDAVRAESQIPDFVDYLSADRDQSLALAKLSATLTSLSDKNPAHIASYALLDSEGVNVVDSRSQNIGLNEAHRDYFRIPLETNRPYVSPVLFLQPEGEPSLYFSSSVRNSLGKSVGVLRIRYNATILQELIEQYTGASQDKTFAILLDENRIRLADAAAPELLYKAVVPLNAVRINELKAANRLPDLPPVDLSTNLPLFEQGLINVTNQPNFTGRAHPGAELEQGAVVRLKTNPAWLVAFVQARSVFLSSIEEQIRNVVLIALGIGLAVTLVAVVVSQRLAKPLVNLTEAAAQVARGNLSVHVPVQSQDEIGLLAETFNSMTTQLRSLVGSLEERVHERTTELALSIEVGQRASAIRDLAELLTTITQFIQEQFNFDYVQVYLVDDTGQSLVLKAVTGLAGEQLLQRRRTLAITGDTVVCWAAAQGEAIVISDMKELGIQPADPLLTEIRSELALPLVVEGRVIGVLDMQNEQVETFAPNNLIVFEAMATQLAIAIVGARQWELAQESQHKMTQVIGRLTRDAWAQQLAERKVDLGFAYDLNTVTPLSANEASGFEAVARNGSAAVPLVIQDTTIGQLAVETSSGRALSKDEEDLLVVVAQQLAQKAETLRLFEETQRQAARQQLAREITDKLRTSRDIETALQTAAEELNKALGTAKAIVDLHVASGKDAN